MSTVGMRMSSIPIAGIYQTSTSRSDDRSGGALGRQRLLGKDAGLLGQVAAVRDSDLAGLRPRHVLLPALENGALAADHERRAHVGVAHRQAEPLDRVGIGEVD